MGIVYNKLKYIHKKFIRPEIIDVRRGRHFKKCRYRWFYCRTVGGTKQ